MVALYGPGVPLYWPFAIISCASAAAHIAHERFQAVETGALLAPRYYPPLPARPLQKRQNACQANHHPCFELGDIGSSVCCGNDEYCIFSPGNLKEAACCKIGTTCGSECPESKIECLSPTTATGTDGGVFTTGIPACCGRRCPQTSMFGCPSSLGNGCCSYDSTCAPGGKCISTIQSSTTEPALVTPIPEGCTTSQITCASSLGGGCCAITQSCVMVDNGVRCAEVTITPTGSGISAAVPPDSRTELGTGAKAGIGVGVIVIAGLIVGGLTYLCLRQRRRRQSEAASSSANPRPRNVVGALIGGGGGRAMTDLNSDSVSRPGGGLPGVAQDYFGPEAQIGPYSDAHHDQLSPGTTPGAGERGGVPILPHGPGDIAAPVEIDSRAPQASPQPASTGHVAVEGTFELYGSDPDPPPENLSPYVPSPSVAESGVSPGGRSLPSPSPGFDGNNGNNRM
ncbi:hypothetical protein V8F20_007493 [Naviculisporaceae sp. PSN 640]